MRKTRILIIALALGFISNGNAQSKQKVKSNQTIQQTDKKMENNFNEEQKKVFSTIEKMVNAFQNKNINGVMASYEKDAVVMFEPQKPVVGTEMLKTAFSQAFGMNPQYSFGGHEIYISGNIATHIAPWTMTGQLPDGTKIEQGGLSIAVLRKQADGNWLIIQDNPHGQFLMGK